MTGVEKEIRQRKNPEGCFMKVRIQDFLFEAFNGEACGTISGSLYGPVVIRT